MSFTQFETNDRVLNTRMNQLGNELLSQITKFSTYDLYLKAGNLMNTQKPTGAGTQVAFANVDTTEKLAFTFNYAIPERLIISTDNKYNLVMPFQGLESNRSYIFRYVYKHEGTTIFDITRNAVTSATGNFTVEFQALNQNTVDIIAEANSTVTLQIYVKTVTGTDASIAMLVNDVNALGRLSRNEATAIITTDNVYEGDKAQEDINSEFSSAIGQISNVYNRFLPHIKDLSLNSCHDITESGMYYILRDDANRPPFLIAGINDYNVIAIMYNTIYGTLYAGDFRSNKVYTKHKNDGIWSPWEILTTHKVMQTSLLNLWVTYNPVYLTRLSGNRVTIKGLIYQGVNTIDTILFTVPPEFRPIRAQWVGAFTGNGSSNFVPQAINISTDGAVRITYTNSQSYIFMDVEYDID